MDRLVALLKQTSQVGSERGKLALAWQGRMRRITKRT